MALPTSAENTWLTILEIIDSKGKGYSTNFTGLYPLFIKSIDLQNIEVNAEIEENIFVVKEILKIGRDTLLDAGLLVGTPTSFEISKKGKSLMKYMLSQQKKGFSELSIDDIYRYVEYNISFRKKTIIINGIEYTTKGWDKKVFKFAETFNNNLLKSKSKQQQTTLFENINTSANFSNRKNISDTIKELIEGHEVRLKKDLIEKIKKIDPFHFEELSTHVIFEVVYDGKITDELKKNVSRITKKTGDGGIDGIIIKKEKFGSDKIYYIQAKRYSDNNVGIEAINSFFAALTINDAKDGLLITTSKFSQQAMGRIKEFEHKKNIKIIPIDGEKLVSIMIENSIGITSNSIDFKSIDESFFVPKK